MSQDTRRRAADVGAWGAAGAALAVVTGSTPIGIAIVAGVAGALAWRTAGRRSSGRRAQG